MHNNCKVPADMVPAELLALFGDIQWMFLPITFLSEK
jgi:hypothetical protein